VFRKPGLRRRRQLGTRWYFLRRDSSITRSGEKIEPVFPLCALRTPPPPQGRCKARLQRFIPISLRFDKSHKDCCGTVSQRRELLLARYTGPCTHLQDNASR
jgi:hypothetical protein